MLSEGDQKLRRYCATFAQKHVSLFRAHIIGKVLGKEHDAWRSVSSHCLMAGMFADVLAEQLHATHAGRRVVCQAAILHDWAKRREVERLSIEMQLSPQSLLTIIEDQKRLDREVLLRLGITQVAID